MTGIREDGEQPRIKELLQQAIQSIDHARSALTRKEARGFADHVWLAAFYLEYLTFVLSLTRPPADDAWKQRATRARAGDVAATLTGVHDLLTDAAAANSVEDLYRKTWLARGRLLRVQRRLDQTKAEPFQT